MSFVREKLPTDLAAVMFGDMVVVDARLSDAEAHAAAALVMAKRENAFTYVTSEELGVEDVATSRRRETQ